MANKQYTINNKGLEDMLIQKPANAFVRLDGLLFIVYCLVDAVKPVVERISLHKTVRA